VIGIVKGKIVVVEAVGEWKSLVRFPRAFFARNDQTSRLGTPEMPKFSEQRIKDA
jgi:hypothetical protein